MSWRPLTREEAVELRELHHIVGSDMTVDAGEAALYALNLAAEAIDRVLFAGRIEVEDDDPPSPYETDLNDWVGRECDRTED